jgi:hypothetical protein
MQAAIHSRPDLVLSGIPEINPQFCPDAPGLLSLGREISLSSGPIDNLFIDVNAVLTFVECKRYSDNRIKREVYPQALNYASDLQNLLANYNREEFHAAFCDLISSAKGGGYRNLEEVLAELGKDPILEGKNTEEWRRQFLERFEYNIKSGVCRVVLLCAPTPNNVFNYRAVRNLMQLMSFSEHSASRYDLVLMDLREERDALVSRIVWRRYAALPQIPLIVEAVRDTSAGIDRMKEREAKLPEEVRQLLGQLLESLSEKDLIAVENTGGYALKSEDTKKSVYVQINVRERGLSVVRHQIRPPERLYTTLEADESLPALNGLDATIKRKPSSLGSGSLFEIEFALKPGASLGNAENAIIELARSDLSSA